jgi:hypothetical protein
MNPKRQWITFAAVNVGIILVACGLIGFTLVQATLKADAGPDQTVSGPSLVLVAFTGLRTSLITGATGITSGVSFGLATTVTPASRLVLVRTLSPGSLVALPWK